MPRKTMNRRPMGEVLLSKDGPLTEGAPNESDEVNPDAQHGEGPLTKRGDAPLPSVRYAGSGAAPAASIMTGPTDDFPAEFGEVLVRAEKPDGSTVVVTTAGRKFRRAAPGEPFLDTVLLAQ